MCGIIGYVGSRECKPLLIQGLERLEYRGYDSSGLALLESDGLDYVRAVGVLDNLKARAGSTSSVASPGLGHTRWGSRGGVGGACALPRGRQALDDRDVPWLGALGEQAADERARHVAAAEEGDLHAALLSGRRSPKMAVPMRTIVAPAAMAASMSSDMPIESVSKPNCGRSAS